MDQDPSQDQACQGRLLPNRIAVSVIVPVYNNPEDLEDCLSALLNASGPDSELIVVDDGSTDNTASVGERMGVKLLRLAKNSGVAAARNYGASRYEAAFVSKLPMLTPTSSTAEQHVPPRAITPNDRLARWGFNLQTTHTPSWTERFACSWPRRSYR